MLNWKAAVGVVSVLSCASASVWAHTLPPPPSLDNWKDLCEVTDPEILEVARSTCFLVSQTNLIENQDGTYKLIWQPMTQICMDASDCRVLCPGSKFYGEPKAAGATPGRSGFLVAPDLVMTAAHFLPSQPSSWPAFCANQFYYVFGYSRSSAGGDCVEVDFDRIPSENVYRCAEVFFDARVLPVFPYPPDAYFIRLEKEVVGRTPLRVRRSGLPRDGDRIVSIGHPHGMSTKVTENGVVRVELQLSEHGQFFISAHGKGIMGLPGSSGSVVYNLDEDRVEALVRTPGLIDLIPSGDPATCWHVGFTSMQVLDSAGINSFRDWWAPMSPHIPQGTLSIVGPLNDVVHRCSVQGECRSEESMMAVSVPATAPGPVVFMLEVEPPSGGTAFPIEVGFGNSNGPNLIALAPGQSARIVAKASFVQTPPGIHQRGVVVHDLTNNLRDSMVHYFLAYAPSIGVTPASEVQLVNRIHPPFGPGGTYVVRNTSDYPLTVRVRTPDDWVSLNGVSSTSPGQGTALHFNLAAAGMASDSAEVIVSGGPLTQQLSFGNHQGSVFFENLSNPSAGNGDTTRHVQLIEYGVKRVVAASDDTVPDGDPNGLNIPFEVDEDICIESMAALLVIQDSAGEQLLIELIAPNGEKEVLWDHQPGSLAFAIFSHPAFFQIFEHDNPAGVWTLRIVDDVPGIVHERPWMETTFRAFQIDPCLPK